MDTVVKKRIADATVHGITQIPSSFHGHVRGTGQHAQMRFRDLSIIRRGECFVGIPAIRQVSPIQLGK
jgi:hypothetical protein